MASNTTPGLSNAARIQSDRISDHEVAFISAHCNGPGRRFVHVVERTGSNDHHNVHLDHFDDLDDIGSNDNIIDHDNIRSNRAVLPRVPNRGTDHRR